MRLRICNDVWEVKFVDYRKTKSLGEETLGICLPESHTILVREDLLPNVKKKVLLHELGHAVIYSSGLRTSLTHGKFDPADLEEVILDAFIQPFLEVVSRIQEPHPPRK